MKEKLTIIKIGGMIIDHPQRLDSFLDQVAALPGKKVLIHGGGKLATDLAQQMGVAQKMVDGRRITDTATLKIVTMVYAGYINKNLVASLNARGCNAVGISGADGKLIQAHIRKHSTIDFGWVGDIDTVDVDLLTTLLASRFLPIIAPITSDTNGQLLNTNADTIAAALAVALSRLFEVQLVYAFEHPGVLRHLEDPDSVIPQMNDALYQQLLKEQVITGGMMPKLQNAFNTLTQGVEKVIIGDAVQLYDLLSGKAGTTLIHE
ncbi:MAG: acetylglutamate kinase [Bacteroidota bacterium]|jgi:acetylglutamate kinase